MKWATRAIILALTVLLASLGLADAAPGQDRRCKHKLQRKAWHTLSKREKSSYLKAEQCLMKLPAKLGYPGTRTRFDELQAAHAMGGEVVHEVGAFLPFHRLLMHAHEQMLRTECGYKGAQPYWDEKHDAGNIQKSVIHDPVYGFGGNGAAPLGCIEDGPFVGYINGIGPGRTINDHCIYRFHNNEASWWMSQAFVDYCYQFEDYATAWWCIKGAPHAGGHAAIGGLLGDPFASPGDPLFYLHHTFLDKVWWDWQALDLQSRLYDIGGTNQQDPCLVFSPADGWPSLPPVPVWPDGKFSFKRFANGSIPFPGFPGGIPDAEGCINGTNVWPPWPQNPGDPGNVTTLGHVLNMFEIVPNTTVRDVMDIGNSLLCYEYV